MDSDTHIEVAEFDIALAGNGPACFERALALARANQHVAVITGLSEDEFQETFYPYQELIVQSLHASANRAQSFRSSEPFGVLETKPEIGWHSVKIHISDALDRVAPHYSAERLRGVGVEIFDSSVLSSEGGIINLENGQRLKCPKLETLDINKPAELPLIEGAELITPHYLENLLEWDELPDSMIILGSGAQALSLAQSLTRLGCQASLVSETEVLEGADGELYKALYDTLETERVRIIEEAALLSIEQDADKITLHMQHQGANRRISAQAIMVIKETADFKPVAGPQTRSVLCAPPLAETGLNEYAAREKYGAGNFHLIKWRYQDTDFGRTQREIGGALKIITHTNGVIIGASIYGPQAPELISFWSVAIAAKLRMQDMINSHSPHHAHSLMNIAAIKGYTAQIETHSIKPARLWRRLFKKAQ